MTQRFMGFKKNQHIRTQRHKRPNIGSVTEELVVGNDIVTPATVTGVMETSISETSISETKASGNTTIKKKGNTTKKSTTIATEENVLKDDVIEEIIE